MRNTECVGTFWNLPHSCMAHDYAADNATISRLERRHRWTISDFAIVRKISEGNYADVPCNWSYTVVCVTIPCGVYVSVV